MRISKTLMTGAVAAVAVAGTASASVLIDNFTQSATAITTWEYGGNGASVDGVGPTDLTFGSAGAGILGKRLLCTNSWGDNTTTASASMIGNGQFTTSLFGGGLSDNQMMVQYRFDSAVDMTQASTSKIVVSGSGSASGGLYGIGIIVFSNLRTATSTVGWDNDGNEIVVPPYPVAAYDGRYSLQRDMSGSQSLGNFEFTAAELIAAYGPVDLSAINGFAVFQYVGGADQYGSAGTWNYTATSFSIVPAPGALALLGVAGIIGGRRRR